MIRFLVKFLPSNFHHADWMTPARYSEAKWWIFSRNDGITCPGYVWIECLWIFCLGGGFKHFLFSSLPLPGEMIQFWRAYFSNGLVQSPTSYPPWNFLLPKFLMFFNDSQKGMFSDLPTLVVFQGVPNVFEIVPAEMINFEPCKNPLRNQPRCSSQMAKVWCFFWWDRGMQPNQVVYTNKPKKKTTQNPTQPEPKKKNTEITHPHKFWCPPSTSQLPPIKSQVEVPHWMAAWPNFGRKEWNWCDCKLKDVMVHS